MVSNMNPYSVGMDMVEINRFYNLPISEHSRFYSRIFDPSEMEHCMHSKNPYHSLAGIFAAKEAVFKAISSEITLNLWDITILHDSEGKLLVSIKDQCFNQENEANVLVSISYESGFAFAISLVIKNDRTIKFTELLKNISSSTSKVLNNEFRREGRDVTAKKAA
jgi:holo-[acyl-carrier-protein] synthase